MNSLLCVDVGTTNTRAWRLRGSEVVARGEAGVGARDVAREGHPEVLRLELARLVGRLLEDGGAAERPSCIAAAGMITSRQGLVEVPYVDAPSFEEGMAELRRSGLPRAFFCLRLIELAGERAAPERLSFALGALVASDLDGWRASGSVPRGRVLVAGGDRLGGAWSLALRAASCEPIELSRADVESGFLAGLRSLVHND
jgi:2-keto-3-deoxy-galactonokinase